MRRPLVLLTLCLALAGAFFASGCGKKTVTTTGSNGQVSTRTVPNVHFAKTKFLLHSGLALGSVKRYIVTPYASGALAQGAPGRKQALVKAAAAGAFAVNELRLARNAALSDDKLRPLADKLTVLIDQAKALLPSLATGSLNPLKLVGLGASAASITTLAKQLGAPITEQTPPTLGG
jgi:hypothetical protein